jgi:hypothetical protein
MTTMTGRRALLLLGVVAALTAAAPAGSGNDPWTKLRRPLHLPALKSGRCPVTSAELVAPGISQAQGQGPVYPVNAYPQLDFSLLARPGQVWYPSQWSGQKTMWIARPKFTGRVLVRGHELGGINQVGFGPKRTPAAELHLEIKGTRNWWTATTYTRLRAPGCYAWQIDGPAFSRVVVFRAAGF